MGDRVGANVGCCVGERVGLVVLMTMHLFCTHSQRPAPATSTHCTRVVIDLHDLATGAFVVPGAIVGRLVMSAGGIVGRFVESNVGVFVLSIGGRVGLRVTGALVGLRVTGARVVGGPTTGASVAPRNVHSSFTPPSHTHSSFLLHAHRFLISSQDLSIVGGGVDVANCTFANSAHSAK